MDRDTGSAEAFWTTTSTKNVVWSCTWGTVCTRRMAYNRSLAVTCWYCAWSC
jgi:hypothetical protein